VTQNPIGEAPPTTLDVAAVLAGHHGADGVREVAQNPFRYGFRALLDSCLSGRRDTTYALLRTKFKPERKLTAYYELTVDGAESRHVCVTWSQDRIPSLPGPASGLGEEGSTGPFDRLAASSEDGRVSVLISPADPAMPQLRRLTDPGYLATVLERLTGRPVPAPRPFDVRTLRYRPGQRHVLMVRSGPGRPGIFVKSDRDDSGNAAVAVAWALAPHVAARCPGAHLAEPLGYIEGDRAAVWSHAPGTPMSHQLTQSAAQAIHLVRLLGQAVRAWHESGAHISPGLRQQVVERAARDVATELETTRRAGEVIAVLKPEVWAKYDAVLTEVEKNLDRIPQHSPTLIHGDLKSDNLLVSGGQLHVLDLDRAAWADPALDLGKLLADLYWWCRDEARSSALGAAFRSGYGAGDPQLWLRADLLAELYRLLFAARRCVVHDPRWDTAVTQQVELAADSLGRGWGR
jgi:Ser/Thr protein kinase RdoA (MazF antagonist)